MTNETRNETRNETIRTASGISPIEAGFGLVHADTIVATTDDVLTAAAEGASISLTVNGATTSGPVADLGLPAGMYDGQLVITFADGETACKDVPVILAVPACIVRQFGARYGSLTYPLGVITGPDRQTVEWDSLWKTNEVADIVVDFDGPHKFVLWRGMSFAPSWAQNNVMTSNFFAETVEPGVFRDCCEMMSDRECRYIHARVIHSSPARAVIHWRQPLADSDYNICRDQWVDEMLYVYPDGVVCRNVTVYLDPEDEAVWHICPETGRRIPVSMMQGLPGKRTFNDMEFITVNAPGATSDDHTPLDALTMMDTADFSRTYTWPTPPNYGAEPLEQLDDYIYRMNYRDRSDVFLASPAEGMRMRLQANHGMRYNQTDDVTKDEWVAVPDLPSNFADHIHWPVTRGYPTTPLTDPAMFEGPTHSFLGYANNAPVDVQENGAVTWCWLSGLAPEGDEQDQKLRQKVRAWTKPAEIRGATYNHRQRAYEVDAASSELQVTAAADIPNATFIIKGIAAEQPTISINGQPLPAEQYATGIERTLDSVKTIITLRTPIPASATITLS